MSVFTRAWKEIVQHRDVLYFMTLKDIKIRYKFSFLGFLWALFQPLGQMVILSLVFTLVVRFKIRAYPAFLLIGLLPWSFFSLSINFTTNTFIENGNLIKKVYFPRLIIPLAQIFANLFDFSIAIAILIPLLFFFHIDVSDQALFLPIILFTQLILTFAISLILSALTVRYRDVKYTKDLLLMFGFYVSPVFYPVSFVKENMGTTVYYLYHLNPMAGLIKMYRDVFYYQTRPDIAITIYTFLVSILFLFWGLTIFYKHERTFADLV